MTITKNAIARSLLTGAILIGASISPASAAKKASVGLNLSSNSVSKSYLVSQIRSQAEKKGVKLSSREVNSAAQSAMNKLKAPDAGPLRGIIHVKLRKITICVAWGKDKGSC